MVSTHYLLAGAGAGQRAWFAFTFKTSPRTCARTGLRALTSASASASSLKSTPKSTLALTRTPRTPTLTQTSPRTSTRYASTHSGVPPPTPTPPPLGSGPTPGPEPKHTPPKPKSRHATFYTDTLPAMIPVFLLGSAVFLALQLTQLNLSHAKFMEEARAEVERLEAEIETLQVRRAEELSPSSSASAGDAVSGTPQSSASASRWRFW